jgi:hypothetical protein
MSTPGGPLSSPYLAELPRFERVMHGWVDALPDGRFGMTVRLADPWVGIELECRTTPSPAYGIEQARGRVLVDVDGRIDPGVAPRAAGLAGLAMTGGFTRRAAEAVGGPGAPYFVDAAIEVARLARQVTHLPPAVVHRHLAEGAVGLWRLDNQGWIDIPGSCYAFQPEAEALFAERPVTATGTAVLYDPPAGARGVFTRTKVARIERRPADWLLTHAMFDEVHGFSVWLAVDPARALVVDAGSLTPRVPYRGLCGEPQARARALIGERVDAGFRKRLAARVGGPTGCAQLFDLTADLIKLLG